MVAGPRVRGHDPCSSPEKARVHRRDCVFRVGLGSQQSQAESTKASHVPSALHSTASPSSSSPSRAFAGKPAPLCHATHRPGAWRAPPSHPAAVHPVALDRCVRRAHHCGTCRLLLASVLCALSPSLPAPGDSSEFEFCYRYLIAYRILN